MSLKKKLVKIKESIIFLEFLNILIFLIGLFSIQVLMLIYGYPRFIFASYDSIHVKEIGTYIILLRDIGFFAFIVTIISLVINIRIFLLLKHKTRKKYSFLNVINILIILVSLLKIIYGLFASITAVGVLG